MSYTDKITLPDIPIIPGVIGINQNNTNMGFSDHILASPTQQTHQPNLAFNLSNLPPLPKVVYKDSLTDLHSQYLSSPDSPVSISSQDSIGSYQILSPLGIESFNEQSMSPPSVFSTSPSSTEIAKHLIPLDQYVETTPVPKMFSFLSNLPTIAVVKPIKTITKTKKRKIKVIPVGLPLEGKDVGLVLNEVIENLPRTKLINKDAWYQKSNNLKKNPQTAFLARVEKEMEPIATPSQPLITQGVPTATATIPTFMTLPMITPIAPTFPTRTYVKQPPLVLPTTKDPIVPTGTQQGILPLAILSPIITVTQQKKPLTLNIIKPPTIVPTQKFPIQPGTKGLILVSPKKRVEPLTQGMSPLPGSPIIGTQVTAVSQPGYSTVPVFLNEQTAKVILPNIETLVQNVPLGIPNITTTQIIPGQQAAAIGIGQIKIGGLHLDLSRIKSGKKTRKDNSYRIPELKSLAKALGLRVSFSKKDLVANIKNELSRRGVDVSQIT